MQINLNGKVAVVTGCDTDIGKEICRVLVQNGAIVFAQTCTKDTAEQAVANICTDEGKVFPLVGDISDVITVEVLAKSVIEKCGHVDILVNNTSILSDKHEKMEIHNYKDDDWDDVVATDVNGVYHCAKYFSKLMVDAEGGRIINVASAGGIVGLQKYSAMVTATSGLLGLTRAMAAELGKYGVLVNAVAVGSICVDGENRDNEKDLLGHIPLGRQGTAKEVANAVAFLAAPEASYMTGATITIDGGWSCGFMRDW